MPEFAGWHKKAKSNLACNLMQAMQKASFSDFGLAARCRKASHSTQEGQILLTRSAGRCFLAANTLSSGDGVWKAKACSWPAGKAGLRS